MSYYIFEGYSNRSVMINEDHITAIKVEQEDKIYLWTTNGGEAFEFPITGKNQKAVENIVTK